MIVGQKTILEKIDKCNIDTVPRTLMLHGPRGSGKHLMCNYIADKLNLNIEDITDTITLEKIEDINNGIEPKIYIIHSDDISIKEQNVLLKLSEEPLKNAVLIYLTENLQRLKPTVLNRCQIWEMDCYSDDELRQFIPRNYSGNIEDLIKVSNTPGKILINCEQSIEDIRQLCEKIFEKIGVANLPNALSICDKIDFKGTDKSKYNVYLFMDIITQVSFNRCLLSHPYCIYDHMLVQKLYEEIEMIENIDKRCLFENFIIQLKRVRNN